MTSAALRPRSAGGIFRAPAAASAPEGSVTSFWVRSNAREAASVSWSLTSTVSSTRAASVG